MRRYVPIVAALLFGAVLLAGTATATATTVDSPLNESDNETEVGICVIGVDSPCNGEEWDGDESGDNETASDLDEQPVRGNESADSGTAIGSGGSETDVGTCVIGADSPCNADRWIAETPMPPTFEDVLKSLLSNL